MKNMEASTIAQILMNEFITRYGVPEILHTDQGRNFESSLIKELCQTLGINKTRTSPYHPQSDGMVLNMLSITTDENVQNWDTLLPGLMLAYRSSVHETTKFTPFQMMFGHQVRLPIDIMFGTPEPTPSCMLISFVPTWKNVTTLCEGILARNRSTRKINMTKKQAGSNFTVNDMVWLHNPAKKSKNKSRKLYCPWQGPFKILEIINDVMYKIQWMDPTHKKIVVHFNRLKPYRQRTVIQEDAQFHGETSEEATTH